MFDYEDAISNVIALRDMGDVIWNSISNNILDIERRRWAAILKPFNNLSHLEIIGHQNQEVDKIECIIIIPIYYCNITDILLSSLLF